MTIPDIIAFDDLIDVYQCAQKDGSHSERAEARRALKDAYRTALAAAPTPPAEAGERDDLLGELYYIAREKSKREFLDIARAALAKPAQAALTDAQLDAAILEWFSYERDQDDFRARMRAAIIAATEAK